MYERFTDRARKVFQYATQEAQAGRHEYVGTEHVLVGLTLAGGSASVALKNANIDIAAARAEIEKIPGYLRLEDAKVVMGRLPHSPKVKKVVEDAIEEAKGLNHTYVGTEHLLLGLLRDRETAACVVLTNLGVNLDALRQSFADWVRDEPTQPEPNPEYIVAEVSKNWSGGKIPSDGKDHIARQFEHVIAVNHGRGYVLHSWQLHRMTTPNTDPRVHIPVLNETIVAVFRRTAKPFFRVVDDVAVEDDGGRDAAAKAG